MKVKTDEDAVVPPAKSGHVRSLRTQDSDEEDEEVEEGYREQEEEQEAQEEVGQSDSEATDSDELDDAVYLSPDELGFQPVKPGIKKRVNGAWRDVTYIRIYGCASYYLTWQFKHVASRVASSAPNNDRSVSVSSMMLRFQCHVY